LLGWITVGIEIDNDKRVSGRMVNVVVFDTVPTG
jgi:hypothetical protein